MLLQEPCVKDELLLGRYTYMVKFFMEDYTFQGVFHLHS